MVDYVSTNSLSMLGGDDYTTIQQDNTELNNTVVFKSGTQTITGLKTFSTLPQSSVAPTSGNQLTNKTYVDNYLSSSFVDLTTNQTVGGVKTFTSLPESSVAPTTNNQFANKAYVDNHLSGSYVDLTSIQNVGGLKTFTSGIITDGATINSLLTLNAPISLQPSGIGLTTIELGYIDGATSNIQTQLNTKALDSAVVKLAGTQTITGEKTFDNASFVVKTAGQSPSVATKISVDGSSTVISNLNTVELAASSTGGGTTLRCNASGTNTLTGGNNSILSSVATATANLIEATGSGGGNTIRATGSGTGGNTIFTFGGTNDIVGARASGDANTIRATSGGNNVITTSSGTNRMEIGGVNKLNMTSTETTLTNTNNIKMFIGANEKYNQTGSYTAITNNTVYLSTVSGVDKYEHNATDTILRNTGAIKMFVNGNERWASYGSQTYITNTDMIFNLGDQFTVNCFNSRINSSNFHQVNVFGNEKIFINNADTAIKNGNFIGLYVNNILRIEMYGNGNYYNFNPTGTARWRIYDNGTTNRLFVVQNNNNGVVINNGANGWSSFSDERVKKNIRPVDTELDNVLKLKPVFYNYKTDEDTQPKRVGFIAQELQQVYPELVENCELTVGCVDNVLTVETTSLIPYLVKAIQELKTQLDAQSAIISSLI
jgi:hypothetical protein